MLNQKMCYTHKERLDAAYQFAASLCHEAGRKPGYLQYLWKELCSDEEILEEFCCYMEQETFACRVHIAGYSIIDIMVWQIDHFKAELDRSDPALRNNGGTMLVNAFDTFLKMRKDPEYYVRLLQSETGTDYPDKY